MKLGVFLAVPFALALAGCHREAPAPTPMRQLPALERAVGTVAEMPDPHGIVTVPSQAVVQRAGISGIFVMRNGQARFQMIKVGRTARGRVEVLSGLSGGERIVLGGVDQIRDGSPITPKTRSTGNG